MSRRSLKESTPMMIKLKQLLAFCALMASTIGANSQEFILHDDAVEPFDYGPYVLTNGSVVLDKQFATRVGKKILYGDPTVEVAANGSLYVKIYINGIGTKGGPFALTNNAIVKIGNISLRVLIGSSLVQQKEIITEAHASKDALAINNAETANHQLPKEPPPKVKKTVDRFKNVIQYALDYVLVDGPATYDGLSFSAGCATTMENGTNYGRGRVDFVSKLLESHLLQNIPKKKEHILSPSDKWPNGNSHDLVFLIDGKSVDLGTTFYKPDVFTEYATDNIYREYMWVAVPISFLRTLASAHNVEYRLGKKELTLSLSQRSELKTLLDLVDKENTNLVEATND